MKIFKRKKRAGFALCAALLLYAHNASWIAGPQSWSAQLLSHRGVHQTYAREGLTNQTCTAERIHPPSHTYIENTLESFGAAIAYGADIIELDIHPTTDGEFAVFHDWTLDCRTNGSGKTRGHDMAYLKTLDIGYGYTADGGQTFPFRGQYIGAMPTLKDVLDAYPNTRFMVNIKSRSKTEARALLDYVPAPDWQRVSVMGHEDPISIIRETRPEVLTGSKQNMKACAKTYALIGWTGYVPRSCRRSFVPVPINLRRFAWGWPNRFEARLRKHGSKPLLLGGMDARSTPGIDSLQDLTAIPDDYSGIIWTDKIEIIGPAVRGR